MKELFDLLSKFFGKAKNNKVYFITPTPFLGYLHHRKYYDIFNRFIAEEDIEIACLHFNYTDIEELKTKLTKDSEEEEKNEKMLRFMQSDRSTQVGEISDEAKENVAKIRYNYIMKNKNNYSDLVKFHLTELSMDKESVSYLKKVEYLIAFCEFIEEFKEKIKSASFSYADSLNSSDTFPFIALSNASDAYYLWATVEVVSQSKINSTGELYSHNTTMKDKAETIFYAFL